MGMGYGANFADTISVVSIRLFCEKELNAFLKAIEDEALTLEDVARELSYEESDNPDIQRAYEKLQEAFDNATGGMGLFLEYHDSEGGGDRYDDVDGVYWSLNNVYEMTEVAKAIKGHIHRKFFVTFG